MSASNDFLAKILQAVQELLDPLVTAVGALGASPLDAKPLAALLGELGWGLDESKVSQGDAVLAALGGLGADLGTLASALQSGDVASAATATANIIQQDIPNFATPASISSLPPPLNQEAFWSGTDPAAAGSLAQELFDYLICSYLHDSVPLLFSVLRALQIIVEESIPDDSTNNRSAYLRSRIVLEQVLAILKDPAAVTTTLWSTSSFDPTTFLDGLESALEALGVHVFRIPAQERLSLYYDTSAPPAANLAMVGAAIYSGVGQPATGGGGISTFDVSVNVMPIPPGPLPQTGVGASPPTGLSLFAEVNGDLATAIPLTPGLSLQVTASGSDAWSLDFQPHSVAPGPKMLPTVNEQFTLAFTPSQPFVVLGVADGTRLDASTLSSVALTFALTAQSGVLEYKIGLQVLKGEVVLDLGADADGFLQSVFGSSQPTVALDATVSWSSVHGFQLNGQASLEVSIPVHATFADVLDLDALYIGIRPNASNGASLIVALSGGFSFGPFSLVVDRLGLQADVESKPDSQQTLRASALSFTFKAPDGLGVSIDAPPISGSGYVAFGQNQYIGWLQLSIDTVNVKAYALIDTQPVSFLLIIQAGFPPIQLGFGFTLDDVGGLVGINRTMSLDALRVALRDHTLDSTLFLDDPVGQAPQLTSIVDNLFPPMDGHYVFGPMAKIGWGTPTLIEAELGFLIELPDPIRIAIVGGIACGLPSQKAALISIHLDVLGTIDFGVQLLSIDATLYDSYVLVCSLSGDMSFRLTWGDQPSFALSIGGWNPKYQPPPGFPSPMTRMTASLGNGNNPLLAVYGYLAITSNALMFGAEVDLYVSVGAFSVYGYVGFDVFFVTSPQFAFTIDIYAGVNVLMGSTTLFCVDLALLLSGPTPWHAHGTATFAVLGFGVSFDADVTWGSSGQAALAPVCDTVAPLRQALSAPGSWRAILPANIDVVASFATPPPDDATILLHPAGQLQVLQTVMPLTVQIQKFGNGTPANADYFAIQVSQNETVQPEALKNAEFAQGQFFNLTDDQKLTSPCFREYVGGATFGSSEFTSDPTPGLSATIAYDDFIVDDPVAPSIPVTPLAQVQTDPLLGAFAMGQTLGTRAAGRSKYAPARPKLVTVSPPLYVVATVSGMTKQAVQGVMPIGSREDVTDSLNAFLAKQPDQSGQLQVVPIWEVQPS